MQFLRGKGTSIPSWQRLLSTARSRFTPNIGKASAMLPYSSPPCLYFRSFFSVLLFSLSVLFSLFFSFSFFLSVPSLSFSLDFSRFSLDLDENLKDFVFFAFEGLLQVISIKTTLLLVRSVTATRSFPPQNFHLPMQHNLSLCPSCPFCLSVFLSVYLFWLIYQLHRCLDLKNALNYRMIPSKTTYSRCHCYTFYSSQTHTAQGSLS